MGIPIKNSIKTEMIRMDVIETGLKKKVNLNDFFIMGHYGTGKVKKQKEKYKAGREQKNGGGV